MLRLAAVVTFVAAARAAAAAPAMGVCPQTLNQNAIGFFSGGSVSDRLCTARSALHR